MRAWVIGQSGMTARDWFELVEATPDPVANLYFSLENASKHVTNGYSVVEVSITRPFKGIENDAEC
jgi:hypothetical protein